MKDLYDNELFKSGEFKAPTGRYCNVSGCVISTGTIIHPTSSVCPPEKYYDTKLVDDSGNVSLDWEEERTQIIPPSKREGIKSTRGEKHNIKEEVQLGFIPRIVSWFKKKEQHCSILGKTEKF